MILQRMIIKEQREEDRKVAMEHKKQMRKRFKELEKFQAELFL